MAILVCLCEALCSISMFHYNLASANMDFANYDWEKVDKTSQYLRNLLMPHCITTRTKCCLFLFSSFRSDIPSKRAVAFGANNPYFYSLQAVWLRKCFERWMNWNRLRSCNWFLLFRRTYRCYCESRLWLNVLYQLQSILH